ncbi:MAG: cytochrome c [Candidatus Scalindua sp.]|nr:cytochrome c [Candidatus Scalindua sp.]MCR4344434.1 cytochrome c [Candidatus Scalindua sp.]
MHKVLIALFIFLTVGSFQYKMAQGLEKNVPSEQIKGADELMGGEPEKEKSELALMMEDIDKDYKIVEEISGYYKYKKKQWKQILEAGENIAKITKKVRIKFAKPDDFKYEEQMKIMQVEAEKMAEIAKNGDKEGALEDQQWQVRRLRQTCAICHKHLDIHIYPNLYKEKKHSG